MLDLHLGNQRENAASLPPCFHFDENVHARIFAVVAFDKANYPKLLKIKDYYADASFITEELPELMTEIEKIMKRFSSEEAVSKALQTLRSTFDTALKADVSVFFFAD